MEQGQMSNAHVRGVKEQTVDCTHVEMVFNSLVNKLMNSNHITFSSFL